MLLVTAARSCISLGDHGHAPVVGMLRAAQVKEEGIVCIALLRLHQELLKHAAVLLSARGWCTFVS